VRLAEEEREHPLFEPGRARSRKWARRKKKDMSQEGPEKGELEKKSGGLGSVCGCEGGRGMALK